MGKKSGKVGASGLKSKIKIKKEISDANHDKITLKKKIPNANQEKITFKKKIPDANHDHITLKKKIPDANQETSLSNNDKVFKENNEIQAVKKVEKVETNGHKSSTETDLIETDRKEEVQPRNIKSLADLIGFCRDSGIQVYNDKPNVPEADRIRMEALGEQGKSKKHCRDDRDPNRPSRSKQNKSGKASTKTDLKDEASSALTQLDTTSRKTSAVPSESSRSWVTSRISSVYSSNEAEDRYKDAEELLLLRMRNRSKRRREHRGTLVGLITEVRKHTNESKQQPSEEPLNTKKSDAMADFQDRTESALSENNDLELTLNETEELKSSKISDELQTLQSKYVNGEMVNTESNMDSYVAQDIETSVTMNEDRRFMENCKEEKQISKYQELSGDETTKTDCKENACISELEHTNIKEETKAENLNEKQEAKVMIICPDADANNETLPLSDHKPDISCIEDRGETNLAEQSDLCNNSSEKDVSEVQSDEIKDSDHNLNTNDTSKNIDVEEKENTSRTATAIIKDEQNGYESAKLDTTDECKFSKDNHDKSKSVDVRNRNLLSCDDTDNKECDENRDLGNDFTKLDDKNIGNVKIKNEDIDQNIDVPESLQNTDVDKREHKYMAPEAGEKIIAVDESRRNESTKDNMTSTDGFDRNDKSKSVDVGFNDLKAKNDNGEKVLDKTDDNRLEERYADEGHTNAVIREEELNVADKDSLAQRNVKDESSFGKSFSKERSDTEILKNVADVNKANEEETKHEPEQLIEELRIKDGKSTLVLYKVRQKSLLNKERNDTDNIESKHELARIDGPTENNSKPEEGEFNPNANESSENTSEHSDIQFETPKETKHSEDKQNQGDVDISNELSQDFKRRSVSSHDDSFETHEKSDKTCINEHDSHVRSENHDRSIKINQDSLEKKESTIKSLSNNNIDTDLIHTNISNRDNFQEETIDEYKSENEARSYEGDTAISAEMREEDPSNETERNNENLCSKQELAGDGNSEEKNAINCHQENTDNSIEIKDKPLCKVNCQKDNESEFSDDEKDEIRFDGKGKGKMESKLESETKNTQLNIRRNSKKGMTAETSITSDRMLSSQARMILLMEKAKQTNENYGKEHIKTIKLFEEARGVFSDLELWGRNGRGYRENSCEENTDIKEEKEVSQTETNDNQQNEDYLAEQIEAEESKTEIGEKKQEDSEETTKTAKEVKPKKKKVKVDTVAPPKLSEEKLRQIREMYWGNGQGNSETFELDGEEYFLDPNGDLVRSIKFNASKKIDTRWDPKHPMFKKLKDRNKGSEIKEMVQVVKAIKHQKPKTNDIPSNNVYIAEAKRIFPKGFEGNKNDKADKTENEKKKLKHLKSFKMKSVDIANTGQDDSVSLTRIETNDFHNPIKRKLNRNISMPNKLGENDKQLSRETVEVDVNKRKLRTTKSVSSKIFDTKNATYNENESSGDNKKLQLKTTNNDNCSESDRDNVTRTTGELVKETKTVKKKKKVKQKPRSSKEFENDYAFLEGQTYFNDSIVKLDVAENTGNAKDSTIKKSKLSQKNSLPIFEFQTKDEKSNKRSTFSDQDENTITNHNEIDLTTDEVIAPKKKSVKKKIKKNRKISNNDINAFKVSKEARDDLPRDLSIIQDTTEDTSQNDSKTKRMTMEHSSSSSILSGKSEMSMQTAVEIMQSRGKFYSSPARRNERNEPREHRVYRLYKEIQNIRRNTAPLKEPISSIADASRSVMNDPHSGFLLLNYERRNKCFCNKSRSTPNADLKRFLYGSINYEVCSKVRGINPTFRRRLKAYDSLKMKMFVR